MLCARMQAMVEPFINNELNSRDKNEFITHIRECKSCREELEVYHVIYSVIEQLDKDSDKGSGYLDELEEKLTKSADEIKHQKTMRVLRHAGMVVLLILVSVLIS